MANFTSLEIRSLEVQSEMNGAIHTSQRLYSVFLLASGRRQFISLQCLHVFEVISLETIEARNTIKKDKKLRIMENKFLGSVEFQSNGKHTALFTPKYTGMHLGDLNLEIAL